ncbi:MAG: hypothetical protein QHH15_00555, partial [Candidatus Thermoplasmatota archaeon]|nr:hypothetical protein [Candidatus Thermoplasmatota archaeon]
SRYKFSDTKTGEERLKILRAGVMYLEKVSNKSEKEILNMPYPQFREYISFYTDAEEFIKPKKMTKEQESSELERIKMLKKQLER